MDTTILKVSGMTCGGCVRSVANVLKALPGVEGAEVSLEQAQAKVSFDPARTSLTAMRKAIADAGFEAH